jgi:hypothetical protein
MARCKPDTEYSRGIIDGYVQLAAAVVNRAVWELANGSPVERMDALCWFVSPVSRDLCEFAGVNVDPLEWVGTRQAKKAMRKIARSEMINHE